MPATQHCAELRDLCSSISIEYYYQGESDGRDVWHVCGNRIVRTELWLANMKERDGVEDLDIYGGYNTKIVLKEIR